MRETGLTHSFSLFFLSPCLLFSIFSDSPRLAPLSTLYNGISAVLKSSVNNANGADDRPTNF